MEDAVIDYTSVLNAMADVLAQININTAYAVDFLKLLSGIAVFLLVVILCHFVYKFFRIFF